MRFFRRLGYRLLVLMFGTKASPEVGEVRKVRKRERVEQWGSHYYMGDLLDGLDDYLKCMRAFRKHDPDGYGFYSKVGGLVLNRYNLALKGDVPAVWRTGDRPTTGFIHLGTYSGTPDDGTVYADFIYFTKLARQPHDVQVAKHDLYKVFIVYIEKKEGWCCSGIFHMDVSPDGEFRLLKRRLETVQSLPGKYAPALRGRKWVFPPILLDIAKRNKETPEEAAHNIFMIAASYTDGARAGIQVRAKKNGVTACFCIDMLRTPYFFADRDKTVNENGQTKRIFHIVRTHRRALRNGTTQNVRSHFRGLRNFDWFGYRVSITVPGLHHKDIRVGGPALVDLDEGEDMKGYVTSDRAGKMVDQRMSV